jgi:hypothetical protein
MRRVAFFLLALPMLAFCKDTWKSGQIKVIDTDEWCGRPGAVDWPAICGTSPSGATRLVNDSRADAVRPANPYSQILEIDGPDAVYIVRSTRLDGALQFRAGALAQFSVDGKHLKIKFDKQGTDRNGDLRVHHASAQADILEIKGPSK